jgi:hypothetical protein
MKLRLIYPSRVMLHLHRLDLSVYRPPHRHPRRKAASLGRYYYHSKRLWHRFRCRPSIEVGGKKTAVFGGAPSWKLHGRFFVVGQLIDHRRHQPFAPYFHLTIIDGIYRYHDQWDGFSHCIAISSTRWLFRHRAQGDIVGPTPPRYNLHHPKTIIQQSTTDREWLRLVGGGRGVII